MSAFLKAELMSTSRASTSLDAESAVVVYAEFHDRLPVQMDAIDYWVRSSFHMKSGPEIRVNFLPSELKLPVPAGL